MNKETKHIPGPWALSKIGNNYDHWAVYGNDDSMLCNTVYGKENADLVAAAPELLEALQSCVKWAQEFGMNHGVYEDAQAAINKALGNQ